ncbi:hypothetical protein HDU83_002119 [Entophlyctis luteolus]|nr:hypothetical protein HDU83_002119 [Entophlyctis luteolus]
MEAQDLVLVVYIDYFDLEETPRRVIAFQGPIKIVPADFLFDFAGLSVVAALVGTAYVGYKIATTSQAKSLVGGKRTESTSSSSSSGTKKPKMNASEIRAEIAAKKEVLDDEWIPAGLKKKKN